MTDAILVLNAGSSSIKFSRVRRRAARSCELVARGQVEGLGTAPRFVAKDAARQPTVEKRWAAGDEARPRRRARRTSSTGCARTAAAASARRPSAIASCTAARDYAQPVRVDAAMLAKLEKLVPLAPLHQPHNLAPIRAVLAARAGAAAGGVLRHRVPPHAARASRRCSRCRRSSRDAGVRRYGFHGLSYEYIASVLPRFDASARARPARSCSTSATARACARSRRAAASPARWASPRVDGLPMGTRCGALDPGVMLYLMDERGMDARAIENLLYKRVRAARRVGHVERHARAARQRRAARARCGRSVRLPHRPRARLAGGGAGRPRRASSSPPASASTRRRSASASAATPPGSASSSTRDANAAGGPRISTPRSRVAAWVIPTNEELMIARHTRDLLAGA